MSKPAQGPKQPVIECVGRGGALFLGIVIGCEVEHSPPSCAEVKNDRSYASFPPVRL
jgi:hypothetical protein